jgi:hypothetical protein
MPDQGALVPPTTTTAAQVSTQIAARTSWVEATVKAAQALRIDREAMTGSVAVTVLELYEGGVRAMMISG